MKTGMELGKETVRDPTMTTVKQKTLRLQGCSHFRQRVVCATLAGRAIRINDIRKDEEYPGIKDFEASFLRLVDQLTNGSNIEVNETGTNLRYKPGFVVGGRIQHDCGTARSIGWFLEGILPLCPFAKKPINIQFKGITNDDTDLSVDLLRTVTLPSLKHFGLNEGLSLKVKRRGAPPLGGGEVIFTCPIVRFVLPVLYSL
jgi:RNA 3'-terminal phosphate cyclase-like protein